MYACMMRGSSTAATASSTGPLDSNLPSQTLRYLWDIDTQRGPVLKYFMTHLVHVVCVFLPSVVGGQSGVDRKDTEECARLHGQGGVWSACLLCVPRGGIRCELVVSSLVSRPPLRTLWRDQV